jgi:hypothetical protein
MLPCNLQAGIIIDALAGSVSSGTAAGAEIFHLSTLNYQPSTEFSKRAASSIA